MCGIAGILLAPHARDPRRLACVGDIAATLHHRGPDGGGNWIDEEAGIALGHRRLAIVDLSDAGSQPMLSHDQRLVLTYNGEVYNFAALRPELEALGHCFRGHSDSEVMLAAVESYGLEAALKRFAGMFALGIWDRRERILHLVRDRLGKKPLYIALTGGALVFASELRAIRAFPGFQPTVDPIVMAMVLRQGWVPDQHCIWKGVFKLPPGTMLSVRADDLVAADAERIRNKAQPWWSLAAVAEAGQSDPLQGTPADIESELDRLLRLAVGERMVADVPLGAFLSGGIDSSTVVSMMQAHSPRPVRTFTVGFSEVDHDEAAAAAQVAQHLGTNHTSFCLTPAEARDTIPELPAIWDEPFADESQIPTLLVARLARNHVTVALTGDGGDEAFGGYVRHFIPALLAPVFRSPSGLRRSAAAGILTLSHHTWERLLHPLSLLSMRPRLLNAENLQAFAHALGAADERDLYERLTTLTPNPNARSGVPLETIVPPPLLDPVARAIYRDMASYLPGDILVKLDRATMATSLEARCPLLDHRVIEFAWRLPTALKVRSGKGKWILRRVLRRYIPDALFERPKQGFNVPIGAWLKGPLRMWGEDLLAASRLRREGFLDPGHVTAWWQEHQSGRRNRARELWAILMVEAWLDAVRNNPPPLAPWTSQVGQVELSASPPRTQSPTVTADQAPQPAALERAVKTSDTDERFRRGEYAGSEPLDGASLPIAGRTASGGATRTAG
jgi:asparagine synthase (glutamine-hydrolysing)